MIKWNGMSPEMIGPGKVKCLSVGDRFTTQKNYKNIEQMGLIRSYVTMPTVRNIQAGFLVRGRSQDEIDLTLQHVTDWLMCGEARIQTRQMKETYYKAVCSEIAAPVYSPVSAKFTVTFVCTDYRMYRTYDDKPVSGADPGTDNFTFNGKHCLNDMGCMFVMDERTLTPDINIHKYEIPGRSGTLRYDDKLDYALGEGKIKGTLYMLNTENVGELVPYEEQEQRLKKIYEWLITARRAGFVWDSDPQTTYLAEVEDETTFDRSDWPNGKISIEFVTQPYETFNEYEEAVLSDSVFSVSGRTTVDLSALFPNGITNDTGIRISIKNTEPTESTVTGSTEEFVELTDEEIAEMDPEEVEERVVDNPDGSQTKGEYVTVTTRSYRKTYIYKLVVTYFADYQADGGNSLTFGIDEVDANSFSDLVQSSQILAPGSTMVIDGTSEMPAATIDGKEIGVLRSTSTWTYGPTISPSMTKIYLDIYACYAHTEDETSTLEDASDMINAIITVSGTRNT